MARRAQVRVRWFLGILGIVSLPFLIAIFIFLRGERIIVRETNRVNQAQLNVLGTGLDSVVGDVRELELAMVQDPGIRTLATGELSTTNEYLLARSIIDRYSQQRPDSGAFVEWVIYLPGSNKVLSRTTYTSDFHYLDPYLFGAPPWTLSRWRLDMRGLADRGLTILPRTGWSTAREENVLVYSRHLGSPRSSDPAAILAFVVTTPFVVDLLDVMLSRPDDALILSDGRSELVFRSSGNLESVLSQTGDSLPTGLAAGAMPWSYEYSLRALPVELTYAIGGQGAIQELRTNRLIGFGALLLCLVAAVGLTGFLVKRQYSPIGRMVAQIIEAKGSSVRVASDEFRIIEEALSRTVGETEELRALVLGHERSLERYRFRASLRGAGTDASESAEEFLRYAGIREFAIALLDPFPDAQMNDLATIAERAVRPPAKVVDALKLEGGACLVLGSPERVTHGALRNVIEEIRRRVLARTGTRPAVAISRPHPISHNARGAVEEAFEALAYRIVDGTDRVLEPHITRGERDTFEFTLQQENELANTILAGDRDGARAVTEDILHRNFELKELSIEMGRCLAFSLATMFVRSMNRASRYRASSPADRLRPIERIAACRTYEDLRTTIFDLLETVCTDIASGRASHTEILVEQIAAFARDHLPDPNLGTKTIADHFDMNAAYLSRLFREHNGFSFSDYVNMRRIALGKELLRSTDQTIAAIGQEIGYPESSSFIRFFKKFEGITPGVYRDEASSVPGVTGNS